MKAIVLEEFGGTDKLLMKDVDIPDIREGEVLVKTEAIGVNPVDYKTRQGRAAAERLTLPIILGWDVCGEVVKANPNSRFTIGDVVFGMIRFPGEGKTYAEYVAAPEDHLVRKPDNISATEAGAIPLAALTAYQALIHLGEITKDSRVLVQGASGGVGHFAVQIAKHTGAYVIGTASTKNMNFVRELGADECVDYTRDDVEEVVRDIDVALDCAGGDVAQKTIRVIKDGGKLISLPSPFDETMKSLCPTVETPWMLVHSDNADMQAIADLVDTDKLHVHIHQTFGFHEMAEAHTQLENGKTVGKTVVVLDESKE